MDEQEIKTQMARIEKYRQLQRVRDEIHTAIKAVRDGDESGPCGQGPFTGNTRESRQVQSIHIHFTATRGGAPAVEKVITGLHIEAADLGNALESMLRDKLKPILDEMDTL